MERDPTIENDNHRSMDFNSHAHVERDNCFRLCTEMFKYFNSHAHVERDLLLSMLFSMFLNFNSHAHVERDYHAKVGK